MELYGEISTVIHGPLDHGDGLGVFREIRDSDTPDGPGPGVPVRLENPHGVRSSQQVSLSGGPPGDQPAGGRQHQDQVEKNPFHGL